MVTDITAGIDIQLAGQLDRVLCIGIGEAEMHRAFRALDHMRAEQRRGFGILACVNRAAVALQVMDFRAQGADLSLLVRLDPLNLGLQLGDLRVVCESLASPDGEKARRGEEDEEFAFTGVADAARGQFVCHCTPQKDA